MLWTNLEGILLKQDRGRGTMIPLTESIWSSQIHKDKKVQWWLPRLRRGGSGDLAFNGYRAWVSQDEKSSGN